MPRATRTTASAAGDARGGDALPAPPTSMATSTATTSTSGSTTKTRPSSTARPARRSQRTALRRLDTNVRAHEQTQQAQQPPNKAAPAKRARYGPDAPSRTAATVAETGAAVGRHDKENATVARATRDDALYSWRDCGNDDDDNDDNAAGAAQPVRARAGALNRVNGRVGSSTGSSSSSSSSSNGGSSKENDSQTSRDGVAGTGERGATGMRIRTNCRTTRRKRQNSGDSLSDGGGRRGGAKSGSNGSDSGSDTSVSLSTPTSTEQHVVSYARRPDEGTAGARRDASPSALSSDGNERPGSDSVAHPAAVAVVPSFVVQYDWPNDDGDDENDDSRGAAVVATVASRGGSDRRATRERTRAPAGARRATSDRLGRDCADTATQNGAVVPAGGTRRSAGGRQRRGPDRAAHATQRCRRSVAGHAAKRAARNAYNSDDGGCAGDADNQAECRRAPKRSTARRNRATAVADDEGRDSLAPNIARFLREQRDFWQRIDNEESLTVLDANTFYKHAS